MDRLVFRSNATWGFVAVVLTMCGCSLFPEALQPQNLQKLNRGPAPSHDPFFSVPAERLADDAAGSESPGDDDGEPNGEQPD